MVRKLAVHAVLLTMTCLITTSVSCWSAPKVSKESTLRAFQGAPFRPRMAGDWVLACQNVDDKACMSTTKAINAYNLLTGEVRTAFEGSSGWPETSGSCALWTASKDLIDSFFGVKGYTRQGRSGGTIVVLNVDEWRYYTPVVPTKEIVRPTISGTILTWVAGKQVHILDIITNKYKQVSQGEDIKYLPRTGGSLVVWGEGADKAAHIHVYDMTTGVNKAITSEEEKNIYPVTDGKIVVWWQPDAKTIWGYDAQSGTRFRIAEGFYPCLDGGIVVYMKYGPDYGAVYGTVLATREEFRVSKGVADQGPDICNGRVTWCKGNSIYWAELDLRGQGNRNLKVGP